MNMKALQSVGTAILVVAIIALIGLVMYLFMRVVGIIPYGIFVICILVGVIARQVYNDS